VGRMARGFEQVGLLEKRLHAEGFSLVAGVDEVGRGALAGPLVVCAVILPPDYDLPGLRNSKLLTAQQRGRIAAWIRDQAIALNIVRVTPGAIDRYGLHRSNLRALRRAVARLQPVPEYALADGYAPGRLPIPVLSVKKGDRVAASVAAASIVAKVVRDRSMVRLHRRYPAYGFNRNKGYGTREHWDALRLQGPSEVHRHSFTGVLATATIAPNGV
jgi:ribonuclease HII